MKRGLILISMMIIALGAMATDYTTAGEVLRYDVVYQWGVIWKHAADAKLTIKRTSSGYNAMLTGKTRSWADKVYPVRDTLKCAMNAAKLPLRYEKLTHEDTYYARDVVKYTHIGNATSARCTRYRVDKPAETINLSTPGTAYDMLSVFYMLRDVNYDNMALGSKIKTVIFSGKEQETLTITYKGREKVKLRDGSSPNSYHLIFKFTRHGGTESSEGINAWMSTDDRHIPLLLVGKLPVGEVKVYYRTK